MDCIASGIFTWDGAERRSNRYGAVVLDETNYHGDAKTEVFFDYAKVAKYKGKKVRLTCKVRETRKSGHVGDVFLGVYPSTPDVGEEIEVGVGTFNTGSGWGTNPSLMLIPNDDRSDLWMDPRKLYRLHDQTVDVYIEETTDDFTKVEPFDTGGDKGAQDLGSGEIQVKGVSVKSVRVPLTFTKLEDGVFAMEYKSIKGRRF